MHKEPSEADLGLDISCAALWRYVLSLLLLLLGLTVKCPGIFGFTIIQEDVDGWH